MGGETKNNPGVARLAIKSDYPPFLPLDPASKVSPFPLLPLIFSAHNTAAISYDPPTLCSTHIPKTIARDRRFFFLRISGAMRLPIYPRLWHVYGVRAKRSFSLSARKNEGGEEKQITPCLLKAFSSLFFSLPPWLLLLLLLLP